MPGWALLCPGQGAQHPGMLDLALSSPAGRAALGEASEAAEMDIVGRVRAGEMLFDPVFAQVCIVAAAACTWQALATELPQPDLVAGYSAGEVSAWCCAGTWTVAETMAVIVARARAMVETSPPGATMIAITALRAEQLLPIANRHALHVAIEIEADHWVVGGRQADIDAAAPALQAAGGSLHALPVSVPSHTPLLSQAATRLRAFLAATPGRTPRVPVLRGVEGRSLFTYPDATAAIADAVERPIRWRSCMDELAERGIAGTLELPPGGALTRMLAHRTGIAARAVADFRSVEGIAHWVERFGRDG